ncbi:uncharacterized protein DAT39_017876, partial [Clarias magur]
METLRKQIHNLQVKLAQLQQQKAALESSWTDTHLSQTASVISGESLENLKCPGVSHITIHGQGVRFGREDL